jgi:hypothetical protein
MGVLKVPIEDIYPQVKSGPALPVSSRQRGEIQPCDELSANASAGKGELVVIAKQMTGASPRSKAEALRRVGAYINRC